MTWLDIHRRRATNEGGDIKNEHERQSVEFIRQGFKDSPSYIKMLINNIEYDTRSILDKRYNLANDVETKLLLLLPYETVNIGDIAVIGEDNWLVMFFNKMDLKPKVNIRFCNEMLKFDNGNAYPCVVDNKLQGFQTVDEFKQINLPADSLKITMTYNEDTRKIKELDRFVFNGSAFEVQAFDRVRNVYKGVGIIDMIVQKVPIKEGEVVEVEKPLDEDKDIIIQIIGSNEMEINSSEEYVANVYENGILTNYNVIWNVVGDATVIPNGIVSTGNNTGMIELKAEYLQMQNGIPIVIETTKKINVVDNDDWGWG